MLAPEAIEAPEWPEAGQGQERRSNYKTYLELQGHFNTCQYISSINIFRIYSYYINMFQTVQLYFSMCVWRRQNYGDLLRFPFGIADMKTLKV